MVISFSPADASVEKPNKHTVWVHERKHREAYNSKTCFSTNNSVLFELPRFLGISFLF